MPYLFVQCVDVVIQMDVQEKVWLQLLEIPKARSVPAAQSNLWSVEASKQLFGANATDSLS